MNSIARGQSLARVLVGLILGIGFAEFLLPIVVAPLILNAHGFRLNPLPVMFVLAASRFILFCLIAFFVGPLRDRIAVVVGFGGVGLYCLWRIALDTQNVVWNLGFAAVFVAAMFSFPALGGALGVLAGRWLVHVSGLRRDQSERR